MADDKRLPTRPHGDPLRDVLEDNPAQRQSEAPPDELGQGSDRDRGRGSTANGIPTSDEDSGQKRRKLYEEGADLVSGLD